MTIALHKVIGGVFLSLISVHSWTDIFDDLFYMGVDYASGAQIVEPGEGV